MSSPAIEARKLLHQVGWSVPGDLTLEEIIYSIGGILKYVPLTGSEGRILIKGDSAIITINSDITYEAKRNFVTAHEIGHYSLHKGLVPFFSDTDKTLADWYKNGPHELQANEFASEFLMPSPLFKQKVTGKKLSIALIEDVAQYFKVSLTAAFLKYRMLGDFPVMVIFIEDGIVKWKQASNDFPFQYLVINSKVPVYSIAGDHFNNQTIEAKPEKVDAIEWFPEDSQIKYKPKWQLWEQCFKVSDNGIISCLWSF